MAQGFIKSPDGSGEPQAIGQALGSRLENSGEPLASAFLQQHPDALGNEGAEDEGGGQPFEDVHPNTELGVDLKLFTRTLGRMGIGEVRPGAITRDDEGHFTFFESGLERKEGSAAKRNPHALELIFINVNRKDDGTLYPTFNRPRYTEGFTFQDFCRKAAEELLMVAGASGKDCLVGEAGGK